MGSILAVAVLVGAIHFAAPLAYYMYLRGYLHKSWNLRLELHPSNYGDDSDI